MMMIFLYLLLGLVALSLLIAYICFRMAFLVVKRSDAEIPPGKEYEPYRAQLKKWMEEARNMPCEASTAYARCKAGPGPLPLIWRNCGWTQEKWPFTNGAPPQVMWFIGENP
jgi:hypothetical protein